MAFGHPGAKEFGTYFIGYARSPAPLEQMLDNMFVGRPPGNYDRLLDYSRAVTGGLFFVPPTPMLDSLAERDPASTNAPASSPDIIPAPDTKPDDGSLKIGSLKGIPQHE
jgi:porphyrinogen peroxidase